MSDLNKHEIRPDTIVQLGLTGWGRFLYDQHVYSHTRQDFEERIDDEREAQGKPRRRGQHAPRALRLPLWEAMAMFGPHIKCSDRLPFEEVQIELPPSEREQHLAEQLTEGADVSVKLIDASRMWSHAVADLGRILGIDIEHTSPDLTLGRVQRWINETPPAVPDKPGPWWRNGQIERVEWDNDGGEVCLVVRYRNNRRRLVADLDGWEGPCVRDPRVKIYVESTGDDEDIPF